MLQRNLIELLNLKCRNQMIYHFILSINKFKEMRNITKLTIFFICLIILNCEKEDNNKPLIIKTNNDNYTTGELVSIEIVNKYDTNIDYYMCSSYSGIPPVIYKYINNVWTGYWAPLCDGFISHCCGVLETNDIYKDTFNLEFEQGKYRIEYEFIVEYGQGYQSFYSNEFIFE